MYIFELIAKVNNCLKNGNFKLFFKPQMQQEEEREEEKCEHIFVPIDSTKKVLACSKCGFMVRVEPEKIKKQNPFKENNVED